MGATERMSCPIAPQVSWTWIEERALRRERGETSIHYRERERSRVERKEHALPFVKGRPGHLNSPNDTFLKVLRVLLHDDDTLLEGVLLVDLLLKLTGHKTVGVPIDQNPTISILPNPDPASRKPKEINEPRILLRMNAHRRVLEHRNAPRQIGNKFRRKFPLLRHGRSELSRVLLNVLDVRLELRAEFLEVLHYRTFHRFGEVGVVVCDQAGFLALRGET